MARTTCPDCRGEGRLPTDDADYPGEQVRCPKCDGLGDVEQASVLREGEDPIDLLGRQVAYTPHDPQRPWLTPFVAEVVGVRLPTPGVVGEIEVLLAGKWRYVPLAEVEPAPAVRS